MIRKLTPVRVVGAIKKRSSRFARLTRAGRVVVGHGTYGMPQIQTFAGDDATRLILGRYCSVASTSEFLLGGEHPTDRTSMYPIRIRAALAGAGTDGFPSSKGDIVVEDGAWIGHRALILSGVRIGRGAAVAAGAVVVKDVPPYAIVGGNPAKLIRMRFEPGTVQAIEDSRWWEWDNTRVAREVEKLNGIALGH